MISSLLRPLELGVVFVSGGSTTDADKKAAGRVDESGDDTVKAVDAGTASNVARAAAVNLIVLIYGWVYGWMGVWLFPSLSLSLCVCVSLWVCGIVNASRL